MNEARREIDQHITGIIATLNNMEDQMTRIEATLDRLSECMYGNGKVGMTTRVDRLERSMGTLSKATWIIVASLIAAIATRVMGAW